MGLIDLPLQPIIDIEKPWLPPHAFAPNPSNPMESEMLPIDQVFRTVHLANRGIQFHGVQTKAHALKIDGKVGFPGHPCWSTSSFSRRTRASCRK